MSRHLSYDDMLEQLDRFIESLDARMTPASPVKPTDKPLPCNKPLPEAGYEEFEEEQEAEALIFMRMPV